MGLSRRQRDYVLRNRGRLSLAQIARRLRVPKASIQEFLLNLEHGEGAPPAAAPAPAPAAEVSLARTTGRLAWVLGGLGLVAVLTLHPVTNNDIWLHLKTGELILDEGSIPQVERYSFTAAGRPLVPHEWGAAVIFALAFRLGGIAGLIGLKALLAAATAVAVAAAARGMGARPAALAAPGALALILVSSRLLERPHLWTYLLSALFLLILDRHRRRGGPVLYLLLPLQALWANLHGGFVVGWLLAACYLAGEAAPLLTGRRWPPRRHAWRLAAVLGALPLACMLNPVGPRLLLFPLQLTGNPVFMLSVYEWLPTFSEVYRKSFMFREYLALLGLGLAALWLRLRGGARWLLVAGAAAAAVSLALGSSPLLAGSIAAMAAAAVLGRGSVPAGPALAVLALFFLSTRMNRTVTDFAIVAAAPLSAWLDRSLLRSGAAGALLRRRPAAATAAAGLALGVVAIGIAWFGYWYNPTTRRSVGVGRSTPAAGAVEFLEAEGIGGRALASYNAAPYLIWKLHPRVLVFVDTRNEAYDEKIFRTYLGALRDPATLASILESYQVEIVLLTLAPHPPLEMVRAMDERPDFALVFLDDRSAVYLRRDGAHRGVVERLGYRFLSPVGIGREPILPENAAQAVAEARRAIAACTHCLVPRAAIAEAAFVLGDLGRAREMFEELIEDSPDLYPARMRLGDIHALRGDAAAARVQYEWVLRSQPEDELARRRLQALDSGATPPSPSP